MTTSIRQYVLPRSFRALLLAFTLALTLALLVSCSDTVTEEQVEYTQGVITLMEEVSPEQFRIVDETVVPNKEDSRIITQYLDGHRDTVTLYEAQAMVADTAGRRAHYHRTYYGGLMGYYLGRSAAIPPSPGVYRDEATYNRVQNTAGTSMERTARRTTVTRPANASKGYGSSSKSTRSYGG